MKITLGLVIKGDSVSVSINGTDQIIVKEKEEYLTITTKIEVPAPVIKFSDTQDHVVAAIDQSVLKDADVQKHIAEATAVWEARCKELSGQVERRDKIIEQVEGESNIAYNEISVWKSRAYAHEVNYKQMLERVDVLAKENQQLKEAKFPAAITAGGGSGENKGKPSVTYKADTGGTIAIDEGHGGARSVDINELKRMYDEVRKEKAHISTLWNKQNHRLQALNEILNKAI